MITYDEAFLKGMSYYDKMFIFDRPVWKGKRYFVDRIKSYFYDLFYKMLLRLFPVKDKDNIYNLSLCSIFKNEAPFLVEWLEYHLLIGVDHFYLYNNNSTDEFKLKLAPYIDKGIVTLVDWPDNPGQLSSYKHWYQNYRHDTKWVSFLDLDEFICPRYNNKVTSWLKKFEKYPVVMVYWKMFGTSGKMEHDFKRLTIEQYVNSWERHSNIGKLFYNTKYDIDYFHLGMMHSINVRIKKWSLPPVNQYGYFVKYGIHRAKCNNIEIQINHYWSKAYRAYEAKHARGDAAFGVSPRNYEYFLWHEQRNNSIDLSIYRFLIQLKQKLEILK